MNPELIVHILEVIVIIGLGVIVVIAHSTICEMHYLCDRLDSRIDFIKRLEKEHRRIEEKKIALTKEAAEGIKKAIDRKTFLEIFDAMVDDPLPDFPNDDKEDE